MNAKIIPNLFLLILSALVVQSVAVDRKGSDITGADPYGSDFLGQDSLGDEKRKIYPRGTILKWKNEEWIALTGSARYFEDRGMAHTIFIPTKTYRSFKNKKDLQNYMFDKIAIIDSRCLVQIMFFSKKLTRTTNPWVPTYCNQSICYSIYNVQGYGHVFANTDYKFEPLDYKPNTCEDLKNAVKIPVTARKS